MITATPFLAAAADAKLEDWGPLEEATGANAREFGHGSPDALGLWLNDCRVRNGVR